MSESIRCEVCGSKNNVSEESSNCGVILMTCKKCKTVPAVYNAVEGDTRRVKKVRGLMYQKTPSAWPANERLSAVEAEQRRIFDRVIQLGGKTTGHAALDEKLGSLYGGYD